MPVVGSFRPSVRRTALYSVGVIVLFAMWSPVLRSATNDSFPLTTYPMFSSLVDPVSPVDVAVGRTASGTDVTLSPQLIAGTDEVIVAGSIITQAVRAGKPDQLCARIAIRVAADGAYESVARIEVRTDTINAIEHYSGNNATLQRTVRAQCEVGQ
jgi:hypothetical protein